MSDVDDDFLYPDTLEELHEAMKVMAEWEGIHLIRPDGWCWCQPEVVPVEATR